MPNRRRHGRQQHRQRQQEQGQEQQYQHVQQQHQQEPQQHQQQRQQQGRLSPTEGEAATDPAEGIAEEAQRRLRLCNANVLDLASAKMHGGEAEEPPNFIRVFASQRISDRKRCLLISWTPMSQQPPTANPIETPPSLEFCSPSGRFTAQITSRPEESKGGSGLVASEASPPQRLEVWGAAGTAGLGCSFCLPAPHGIPWLFPYGGGSFCSGDENLFVYVAEAAPPENKALLDGFLYKDTWGEQLLQHAKGRVFVGKVSPSSLALIKPKDPEASYAQASFVPDGSAIVCTEIPAGPYRLGLKFCINRRASVLLACFTSEGIAGALQGRDFQAGLQEPLYVSWLSVSGDDDWAAFSARVCEAPFKTQGPLLRFEVVYLALSEDCKETRPHFGIVRLRLATVIRQSPGSPWRVENRRTLLGPNPSWGPRTPLGCCEAPNGEGAPSECRVCCVSGPQRDTARSPEADHRPLEGLYTLDLPPWRSRGFLLTNTLIGCRQTIIGVRTDEANGGPIVRRVLLEKPQGPSVPVDIRAAAAAAAVGELLLRDTRGHWMVIQTSSPVHVPVLVLAKLREASFVKETDPQGDPWGPPLIADIVEALSLRGPQDAFDGAIKRLQLHMLSLSLYHLDCQRHWLLRLASSPKGPKTPSLAVIIHGGPHSCSSWRAGRQDVDDVVRTVQEVVNRYGYDRRRCVAVGGSHGGFLCCHLIGQFPKLFSAASTRNPVTYIPAMYATSDIPDFVFPEACREDFTCDKTPSGDSLLKMQQISPTEFVAAIEAPILLALGAKDQRVPPSQGLLFWKLLKAHGKKNKLLWYPEDNHSLDKPATDADYWANTAAWFLEHVPQDNLPPL